jgi:hypothetical protein
MSDPPPNSQKKPKLIGIAADHAGYELKQYLLAGSSDLFDSRKFFGLPTRRGRQSKPDPFARAEAAKIKSGINHLKQIR